MIKQIEIWNTEISLKFKSKNVTFLNLKFVTFLLHCSRLIRNIFKTQQEINEQVIIY